MNDKPTLCGLPIVFTDRKPSVDPAKPIIMQSFEEWMAPTTRIIEDYIRDVGFNTMKALGENKDHG